MMRPIRSALVGMAVAVVVLTGSGAPEVHAAAAAPCTLTPVLLDTTVNQGLQSYPQLVRGKETLVRFYFGLPSCAVSGNAIQVNSAQLTVKNQSASGAVLLSAVQALAPIGTATPPLITGIVKQIDSTSDPKWVVSLVGPTASSFNASFEASVKWQSKTCSTCTLSAETTTAFTFLPGTRSTLITKTVAARTNALRLLVVPMGVPPGGLADTDRQTLQDALTSLSRSGPFSDSGGRLGDLLGASSTAGIRFTVNAGFIDLTPLLRTDGSGQFCGNNSNFATLESSLSSILQSFNSLNGANPADKVVGVVPGSLAIASAVDPTCFEGESSPGGIDSWVRLGSISGAVFTQELMHDWGIEPFSRSNGAYHSIYTTAHATPGDPGKTYNVLERAYIKSDGSTATQNVDRTALISNINNGVTNSGVLLENADWNDAFCFLGGPVPTLSGSACTASRTTSGTAVGVAASAPGPALQITAQLTVQADGTVTDTSVVSSFAKDMLLTGQDTTSPYHIVERDSGGNIVLDFRAPAAPLEGHSNADVHVDSSDVLISSSVSRPVGAVKAELWKGAPGAVGSVKLFTTTKVGNTAPTIDSATATAATDIPQVTPGGTLSVGTTPIETTAIPPLVDIFLLQDETGSFTTQIAKMQSLTGDGGSLITALNGTGANYATGVAGFRDFARDGWGSPGDWIYHRYSNITAGGGGFTTGTPQLSAGGGNDLPEGYLEALHYLSTPTHPAIDSDADGSLTPCTGECFPTVTDDTPSDQQPTWRANAKRIVLLATDDTCHVTGDSSGWPGDDGTTSAATTADILKSANITVIGLTPQGAGTDEIACVKTLAANSAPGGTVQATSTDASTLSSAIMLGLQNLPVTVAASATCSPAGFGLTLTPGSQTVTSGTTASFSETLTAATSVAPGVYNVSCHITSTRDSQPGPSSDQNFNVDVSGLTGPHTLVTWTASDDSTGPLHGDVAMKCNGLFHIIKANVVSDASGKFVYDTPSGCPGGEIWVDVNDGWFLTDPVKALDNVTVNNTPSPPAVAISSPTATSRILEFGVVSLVGTGKSFNGTPLTADQLHWNLDGNDVGPDNSLFTAVAKGDGFDLRPKAATGWGESNPNVHTLTLTGIDAFGTRTATLTFTTLVDHDNDGISTSEETAINACRPASLGVPVTNPDNFPYNATEDNDGDGLPNASDSAPCVAETDFEATTIMLPARLDVSSTSGTLTLNGIYNPFFNMNAVPKSNVRITKVAGTAVSGAEWYATGWLVTQAFNGSLGVATFNRAPLVNFINANPALIGHAILVTVAGTTTDGSKSFHADGQTFVYKSG